jgi:DNA-3-methyladenine glycosylase
MYAQGSTAYVYLCYGIHHLFNVVAGDVDVPLAVLIRAGVPLEGTDIMRRRRKRSRWDASLLAGPGCLSQALGITTNLTGTSLLGGRIWIEDHGVGVKERDIISGPRVGVDYAGADASRPYRFRVDPESLTH